jgi:hypothetical protein
MNHHPHHHIRHNNPTQKNNPTQYNIVISSLQNYMFTDIDKFIKIAGIKKDKKCIKSNKSVQINNNTNNSFFYPPQKDSLFWCFYIIVNGFSKYEFEPTTYIKEKNEKIRYIEMVRNNKKLLKEQKIKPISDIEDYLANKEQLNIKTFIALCILEGINIIIINNQTYVEYNLTSGSKIHVIHQKRPFSFSIELNASDEIIQKYRDTHFQIQNIDKPILSISSYNVSELSAFCKKLQINQEPIEPLDKELVIKKRSKQEMYNLIVSTLNKIE